MKPDVRRPSGEAIWLAPGVAAVAIDADLVFLDTRADSYFCLVDVADRIAVAADGQVVTAGETDAQALLEARLVAASPSPAPRPVPAKPGRDLPWTSRALQRPEIAAAGAAILHTALAFRTQSFEQLLRRAGAHAARGPAEPSDALLDAAAAFARARPWMPIGGACLKRSYLLLTYLRRRGLDADWVVGVRTWPFRAHCWLQAGDVALDDDAERLAAYTPILRV